MLFLVAIFKRLGLAMHGQVVRVGIIFIGLLLYATVGYHHFEGAVNPELTWSDSLWWTIVTMTTVGYGDLYPTTMAGRFLVGFPTMLLGVSVLGYVLSVVATAMVEARLKEIKGMSEIEWKNHILICHFVGVEKTSQVIKEIHKDPSTCDSHIVIIDEHLDELPVEFQSELIHFIKGSPAREATLKKANVANARSAILQLNPAEPVRSDDQNLRTALLIESQWPAVYSCVECSDPENVIFFERANCDSVICMASLSGQMVVQELQDPGVSDLVTELTSNNNGHQFYIAEIKEALATYKEVQQHYSGNKAVVVGIRREGENCLVPADDFAIQPSDCAVMIASNRPE